VPIYKKVTELCSRREPGFWPGSVNPFNVLSKLAHAPADIDVAGWAPPFFSDNSHCKVRADIAYTGYQLTFCYLPIKISLFLSSIEVKRLPTIVHFEIPSDNIERAKKFYSSLFGWKLEKMPGDMEYWMGSTNDERTMGVGVMKRQQPQQTVTNYIDVTSVDEHSKKVEKLGGKIKVPKTEVPGMGWFVVCMDTENNMFGLWESQAK
jgi:predicted enzyme related to lactoylglutathione lyase